MCGQYSCVSEITPTPWENSCAGAGADAGAGAGTGTGTGVGASVGGGTRTGRGGIESPPHTINPEAVYVRHSLASALCVKNKERKVRNIDMGEK